MDDLRTRLEEAEKLVDAAYEAVLENGSEEAWAAYREAAETRAFLMLASRKRRRK